MMDILKRILSGIIIAIPMFLLTVRFLVNVVITATLNFVHYVLGQQNRSYWTVENEWTQYQMDINIWYTLWQHGGGDH